MDKGTVPLDKAKVCEPRGHDWFYTSPGEEPGETHVQMPRPRRALADGCLEAGALRAPRTHRLDLLDPQGPRGSSSPPPEPTSRVTWHAL